MKRKLLATAFLVAVLAVCGTLYMDKVFVPTKVRASFIQGLEEATGRQVRAGSLHFNILKGLVVKDVVISDGTEPLVTLEEGSCSFLIWPFFSKKIVIPGIRLHAPVVYLTRRTDGSLFVPLKPSSRQGVPSKSQFGILVYKLRVSGGRVVFTDETLEPPFRKTVEGVDAVASLSLPSSVRFRLKGNVPDGHPVKIEAAGEYRIPARELSVHAKLKDISPGAFSDYLRGSGLSSSGGTVDTSLGITAKNGSWHILLEAEARGLGIARDTVEALLTSSVRADIDAKDGFRQVSYSGKARIAGMDISGLEAIGPVSGIQGDVTFDNSGLSAQKLQAVILGVPAVAKVMIRPAAGTAFEGTIELDAGLRLETLSKIMNDVLRLRIPGEIQGEGNVHLKAHGQLAGGAASDIEGSLTVAQGSLALERPEVRIENLRGRFDFNRQQLAWQAIGFSWGGKEYQASGVLTNFKSPGVRLGVISEDLEFNALFAVEDKLIKVAQCAGRSFHSNFSVRGTVDSSEPVRLDIAGQAEVDLQDLAAVLPRQGRLLEKMKPSGKVGVTFALNGGISDLTSAALTAECAGSAVSAYGLKGSDLSLSYRQAEGVGEVVSMRMSLYGGSLEANARMNFGSGNRPYWVEALAQDIKLQELKQDTGAKEKTLAGTIRVGLTVNGFASDMATLKGGGTIAITEGNLWQLDFFKGLGGLIFARDFASIVFDEGRCGFAIRDKAVTSDDVVLRSNLAELRGSVRIGFDGALSGALNVQVNDAAAPETGTFKDVATAIIGQAGRFGVIRLGGTLKEPKYSFKPAVVDIIKGLKESLFGN